MPAELNAICLKAMALERVDRYSDTGELATDIEHWLADESVSCYREPQSRRLHATVESTPGLGGMGWQRCWLPAFIGLAIGGYFRIGQACSGRTGGLRADEATRKATSVTEQTRELISRTFDTTFNSHLRNIPGTEHIRLRILELFINQFEKWSDEAPDDFRDRHELAHAIYSVPSSTTS